MSLLIAITLAILAMAAAYTAAGDLALKAALGVLSFSLLAFAIRIRQKQADNQRLRANSARLIQQIAELNEKVADLNETVQSLEGQFEALKSEIRTFAANARPMTAEEINRRIENTIRLLLELLPLEKIIVYWQDERLGDLKEVGKYPADWQPADLNLEVVEQSHLYKQAYQRAIGPGREIILPLVFEDRSLGVLVVRSSSEMARSQEALLEDMTYYLATIAQKARLQIRLQEGIRGNHLRGSKESHSDILLLASDELLRRQSFSESILRSMAEGVIVANLDGMVTFCNQPALDLLRLTEEKMIGRNLLDLLASYRGWSGEELRAALLQTLTTGHPFVREVIFRTPLPCYYQMRVSAIKDPSSNHVQGFVIILSDITRIKELDQTKNEMMSLVSHELRTPLTAIRGYSELLTEQPDLSETARECAVTINEAAQRLARMITTFLDVARIESGNQTMEKTPVMLGAVVNEAVMLMRPVAEEKSIYLIEDIPERVPVVAADRDLIYQVVTNLLSNAIKYSPAGTSVVVSLLVMADYLQVSVTDQGYGIPPEDLEKIWEKFYRVEREQDRETVGTGLGLSFVREIVRRHGGEVAVQSEVGRGSTFSFTLPRL